MINQLMTKLSIRKSLASCIFALFAVATNDAIAQQTADTYSSVPLFSSKKVDPVVMLTMANDHQLFFKAYNDYIDLFSVSTRTDGSGGMPISWTVTDPVGDGVVDFNFNRFFAYEGYFDANRCYSYTNGRFEPVADMANDGVIVRSDGSTYVNDDLVGYCNIDSAGSFDPAKHLWSGRFLNWLTMTRMDIVRYSLYGGYRSTDTASETVLERAYLPNDAHSFAKYYEGDDIYKLADVDQYKTDTQPSGFDGVACPGGGCNPTDGFTFCNTTKFEHIRNFADESDWTSNNQATREGEEARVPAALSQNVNNPPLMRVVKGDFRFWAASERFQCLVGRQNNNTYPNNSLEGEIQYYGSAQAVGANGNNRTFTGITAYSDSPRANVHDYNVRVKVCDQLNDRYTHDCKLYDGGTLKPVGVLQTFDDDLEMEYGLITGGYLNNKNGGVLRKNLGSIDDEINANGTFVGAPANGSIINSLDAMRIVDYRLYVINANERNDEKGSYYTTGTTHTCNNDDSQSLQDGECVNWGNPFGEMLVQSYKYFAGDSIAPVSDSYLTSKGLTAVSASDVIAANTSKYACARLVTLGFDSSITSYDSEARNMSFTAVADINATPLATSSVTVNSLGAQLDQKELANGTMDMYASNGVECGIPAGGVSSIADTVGVCPEEPALQGSYIAAAASLKARKDGVRTDIDDGRVWTYGVTLAGSTPEISLGGLNLVPTCKSRRADHAWHTCSLVDFKVVEYDGAGLQAKYVLAYEDRQYANDYDSDVNMAIDLSEDPTSPGNILVQVTVFGSSTSHEFQFGFVASGTSENANQYAMYYENARGQPLRCNTPRTDRSDTAGTPGFSTPGNLNGALCKSEKSFAISGGTLDTMPPPLYYAAKWGGYRDSEPPSNSIADVSSYIKVQNPSTLKTNLRRLFKGVADDAKTGAGASPAVTTIGGDGLMIQSLYLPELRYVNADTDEEVEASWLGILNGLYIDQYGFFREENPSSSVSTGIDDGDPIVEFFVDTQTDSLKFNRYNFVPEMDSSDPTVPPTPAQRGTLIAGDQNLSELQPLWSANKSLSALADVVSQRTYNSNAGTGRYIFTSIKNTPVAAGDSIITGNDTTNFDFSSSATDFENRLLPLLDVDYSWLLTDADREQFGRDLVDYIRGNEVSGMRSRSVDWSYNQKLNDAPNETAKKAIVENREVWRLGDIANSTTAVVARPSENYFAVYDDGEYDQFRENNKDRRQVAYVGANDGMLHAFNLGFFNSNDNRYELTPPVPPGSPPATARNHPLGSELWGYVPYNLLPHLKWLSEPDYPHVAYVDSSVQVFDVNIFDALANPSDPADKYYGGWGTILVVGMRLGGGEYSIDANTQMKPAYIVMDITDPEQAPRVLAEFTVDDLGHTLGDVEVVKFRERNASTGQFGGTGNRDDWYLLFGSGPKGDLALSEAVSDQTPKLFQLYLNDLGLATPTIGPNSIKIVSDAGTGKHAFVSGITAVDWDRDFQDDAIYYGLVGNDQYESTSPNASFRSRGALMQAELDPAQATIIRNPGPLLVQSASGTATAVDQEFANPPKAALDIAGNRWVFAGSGRYLAGDDIERADTTQYGFYGLRLYDDPANEFDPISITNLFDSTSADLFFLPAPEGYSLDTRTAEVRAAGSTSSTPDLVVTRSDGSTDTIVTLAELQEFIRTDEDTRGWKRAFQDLGEMSATSPTLFGNNLAFNSYLPNSSFSCDTEGDSYFYGLDAATGLPSVQLLFIRGVSGGATMTPNGSSNPLSRAPTRSEPIDGFASTPMVMDNRMFSNVDDGSQDQRDVSLILDRVYPRAWREIPLDFVE